MKKRFYLVMLSVFLVLSLGVTYGRTGFYDNRCHQPKQTVTYGTTVYTIAPCSGTTIQEKRFGFPAFYTFGHQAEFGIAPSLFDTGLFILNLLWIGTVSFLAAVFTLPRKKQLPSPTPTSDHT
ncbi:MAG: hypothetical protein AAB619_01185 [Patescibacteria group bacterium]